MVIIIRKLIWRSENAKHIEKHNVTTEEVEELTRGFHIERPALKGRLLLIGETINQRVLTLVLESKGGGRYYPVTAYDANDEDVALFRNKKEVEKR